MRSRAHASTVAPEAVLSKATLRAAGLLDLTDGGLGAILGVSPASVSRLRGGSRRIDPSDKEGQLALLFIRMFRSVDALLGEPDACRKWMHAENTHLRGVPAELIQDVEGLVHVTEYLDAMRGKL